MRRVAVCFVVVCALVGLTACGDANNNASKKRPTAAPLDWRGRKSVNIDAQDNLFTPPNVIVNPGTKVTWTNRDTDAHDVKKSADAIDFGGTFGVSVGDFGPGKTYSFTLTKVGLFPYMCTIHSLMLGTVRVATGSAPATTVP